MACTYSLSSVVMELAIRAGADPLAIDVGRLEGEVRGFAVTNTYPAYAALQSLSEAFFFDPSNYDAAVHFVHRGAPSVATVEEDAFVADDADIEQTKRSDSIQIPRVLHLNYQDVAGGLSTDKQTSERAGDRRSVGEASVETPVLMTADEAAQRLAISHKVMIEDYKGELKFSLPDSWLPLVVANPIIVQYQGRSERCRITQIALADGYQDITAVRDRQSAYTSDIEGIPAAPQTPPPSSQIGPTLIEPLDIHILRDADDALGYYVAISGLLAAWQGATVELSLDGGENYIDALDWTGAAVMGETLTGLGAHPQAFPDQINTVTVRIDTPFAELLETDLRGLLNRQNLAIVGDEILQFAQAEEIAEGEWTLSTFVRGRRNTDSVAHAPGERFVLLERAVLPFIPANLTDLNRTLTFRATSFGTATGVVTSMLFEGRSQTEAQAAYLQARREGDDAVITWQGVGRLGAGPSVAHGQHFEGYRVTIDDGSLSETHDTVAQSIIIDVSAYTPPITISVQQVNAFTGLGPAIEVILP